MAEATAASDWYVKVKVHNNTDWNIGYYYRILAAAGTIEEEPDSKIYANTTGSGGKYDAPWGPYGVSGLTAWTAPGGDYRFVHSFVMPFIGSNSAKVKIVDKSTPVNKTLFDIVDGSNVTETSQDITVNGEEYTLTVSMITTIVRSYRI